MQRGGDRARPVWRSHLRSGGGCPRDVVEEGKEGRIGVVSAPGHGQLNGWNSHTLHKGEFWSGVVRRSGSGAQHGTSTGDDVLAKLVDSAPDRTDCYLITGRSHIWPEC